MDKEKLKKIINVAGRVITILSLIFVVRAVYRLGFDPGLVSNVPAFVGVALFSALLFAGGVYVQGLAWKTLLDYFGSGKADTGEALCVYAKANIGKYLPGNVMHYVERNLFAAKYEIPQSAAALSSVFEIGAQVAAAFIIAVVTGGSAIFGVMDEMLTTSWRSYLLPGVLVLVCLCVVMVLIIRRFMGEKIKKFFTEHPLPGFVSAICRAVLLCMPLMFIGSAVMVVLYAFMGGTVDRAAIAGIVPGYVMAWLLGFVVPGAPGGIGVREFVLTLTVAPIVGSERTLTMMLIHRLINILGDAAAYLIQGIIRRKQESRE